MSTGFRLFLLILVAFGSVWIYRFRAPELSLLLSPTRPVLGASDEEFSLIHDRARGRLEPARAGWEEVRSADWNLESWNPVRLEAGETPWVESGTAVDEPAYQEVQYDPDLVSGAFEEASGDLEQSTFEEEQLPPPEPESVPPEGQPEPTPPVPAAVEVEYVVQKDDNLWKLAERFLGKGHRYREIVELNSLRGPTVVPGTRLKIRVPENRPPQESLKSMPGVDDKSVEASSGLKESSLARKTYKVKARETLSEIARRYLPGDPHALDAFLDANKETVRSPDEIFEGQILVIPPRR